MGVELNRLLPTQPAAQRDWACNHCVVVVDTTGELGGFWAMRSWPKTFQHEAERVARISQEQRLTHRSYHRARVPRWSVVVTA